MQLFTILPPLIKYLGHFFSFLLGMLSFRLLMKIGVA